MELIIPVCPDRLEACPTSNLSETDENRAREATMSTEPTRSVREQTIPGGWTECDCTVADQTFRLLLPAAPDEFLEQQKHVPTNDEVDPYWAQIWPSARTMAELVLQSRWSSRRALELGCGVGLVGLAALARGVEVTFSDWVPLAVDLAVENARRNGYKQARGVTLDWRKPPPGHYPLIFACDVVYEIANHAPLLGTLQRMLSVDGVAWIGDPLRYHADAFVQTARRRGFTVQIFDASGRPLKSPGGDFQMFRMSWGP
jgi:predicted nicotinamide N-methyase